MKLFRIKPQNRPKNYRITSFLFTIIFISTFIFGLVLPTDMSLLSNVSGSKAEYFDFEFSTSSTKKTSNGQAPVLFYFSIINTGNTKDTIILHAELINITNCPEPDHEEWTYELNKTVTTLEPSFSEKFELFVESSCTCQEGCIATILVTGISDGDSNLIKTIKFNTTRGKNIPPPGDPGLLVDVKYNKESTTLSVDVENIIEVEILNTQNSRDFVFMWVINIPENWSVSLSPEDFALSSNSLRIVLLGIKIPSGAHAGIYSLTVIAQSQQSPNINDRDTIKIHVKPDIIIKDVKFLKTDFHAEDKVKIKIEVQNIGLAQVENVTLALYDELIYTPEHEFKRLNIPRIEPNQIAAISCTWTPVEGEYYLAFRVDPDGDLDELANDNNLRIEPVKVGEKLADEDPAFYYVYLLVLILIIAWVVIYLKYRSGKKSKEEPKDSKIEPKDTKTINRGVYQKPRCR